MSKSRLTKDQKYVVKTAIQCVAIYVVTIGVINVIGKPPKKK